MKRVRLFAAALPVVGVAIPIVAPAIAATAAPLSKTNCVGGGSTRCLRIFGTGQHVNSAIDFKWQHSGTGYMGYSNYTGHAPNSKWKSGTLTRSGSGGWQKHWSPECSFTPNAHVYGWTKFGGIAEKTDYINIDSGGTSLHPC